MKFRTIVADPPWQFRQKSGRGRRRVPYETLPLERICAIGPQVLDTLRRGAHLYLWVPTAIAPWGFQVLAAWGFAYKSIYFWEKITKAGEPDRSGMGFYFRNVVEPCLFGVRAKEPTLLRNEPNLLRARKTIHSRKPDEFFEMVERQSQGPYLELFARGRRPGWTTWGNETAQRVVLITTDPRILPTWREVVADVFQDGRAPMAVSEIYDAAKANPKVARAMRLGHKWKCQIRRTLQEHFRPAGYGVWARAVAA